MTTTPQRSNNMACGDTRLHADACYDRDASLFFSCFPIREVNQMKLLVYVPDESHGLGMHRESWEQKCRISDDFGLRNIVVQKKNSQKKVYLYRVMRLPRESTTTCLNGETWLPVWGPRNNKRHNQQKKTCIFCQPPSPA